MTFDPTPSRYIGQTQTNNPGIFSIFTPVNGHTEQLPLTEKMRKRLQGQTKFGLIHVLSGLIFVVVCIIFMFALGVWAFIRGSWLAIAVAAAVLAAVAAVPYLLVRHLTLKDLRLGYFVRYTGEFLVEERTRQDASSDDEIYWCLRLPHGSIELPSHVVTSVRMARAGQIDFAPNTDMIFEIRDAKDQKLFRM